MHAVTTPAVNIAVHVAFYPIWYAVVGKGKEPPVRKEGLLRVELYIKGITIITLAMRAFLLVTLNTHIVDGLESSMLPVPRIQSVSVTYTIFSSGEKQMPFGRPNSSAIARILRVDGTYRYTWFGKRGFVLYP